MLMSPLKLIVLRLYNGTFSRLPWGSALLRRLLVRSLVKAGKSAYTQTSRYFSWDELK